MSESALPQSGFIARLRAAVADSLKYWELRRLFYNLVLALVVIGHFAWAWPQSRAHVSADLGLGMFLLAVLANIAYSVAYLPDLFLQLSGLREAKDYGRPILLAVGTAFAAVLTHFFCLGFFGD